MREILAAVHRHYVCFLIWLGASPPTACCEEVARPTIKKNAGSMEAWQELLAEKLPPEKNVIDRNAVITRQYACWYLERPDIFKWAGMAAFASHRAGLFLMEDQEDNSNVGLMRKTNNGIFRDIGWAHLAYLEKGFEEIEAILHNRPEYQLMLEGFNLINRGHENQDEELIWQGNLLLLKHEQSKTAQESFEEFSYDFKLSLDSLAWATTLDFDANNLKTDKASKASFEEYERQSRLVLDFTKFEDRWAWVVSEALPKWKLVEATDAKDKLRTIVHCNNNSILISAINWLKKSRFTKPFLSQFDLLVNVVAVFSLAEQIYKVLASIMSEIFLRWLLLPLKVYKE